MNCLIKQKVRLQHNGLLIDYINVVVVHVMHPEARKFYQLEEIWSDADSKLHDLWKLIFTLLVYRSKLKALQ